MGANSFFEDEWYLCDIEGVYLDKDEGETTKCHLNQNGIKLKH